MTLGFNVVPDLDTGHSLLLDPATGQPMGKCHFASHWEGDSDYTTTELTFDDTINAAITALGPCTLSWNWAVSMAGQYLELTFEASEAER